MEANKVIETRHLLEKCMKTYERETRVEGTEVHTCIHAFQW